MNEQDEFLEFIKAWSDKWAIPDDAMIEFQDHVNKHMGKVMLENIKKYILELFDNLEDDLDD